MKRIFNVINELMYFQFKNNNNYAYILIYDNNKIVMDRLGAADTPDPILIDVKEYDDKYSSDIMDQKYDLIGLYSVQHMLYSKLPLIAPIIKIKG
jgi:hypothetical protein